MVLFIEAKSGTLGSRKGLQIGVSALCAVGSVFFASQAKAQTPAYTLYGSENTTGPVTIYAYNFSSSNAFVSQTAAINTGLNYVNGLAFDQSSNRLFYRSGTGSTSATSGAGSFYAYNRATGQQSAALTQSGGTDISTIGFSAASYYNGAYYGVAGGTNDLYKVTFNQSFTTYTAQLWTGNVNNGSAADTFTFGDIAINSSGVLYGFGTVTPGGTGTNTNAQFFSGTIPTTQGSANSTLTSPTTPVNRGTDSNVQLGFSQDQSILFGATYADGTWYTINQTTGVRTAVSGIPSTQLTDLSNAASYQPVPAPPAAVSLGIGSVIGMVGTGVNRLRRSRKKK